VTRARHAHARARTRAACCAVVTVSDTRRGADDRSGARIEALLQEAGHRVVTRAWTPDDADAIRRVVRAVLERRDVDLVIVTGGTGVSPRDRTPEALAPIVDAELPGFGEAFRALSFEQVGSAAWLSRAGAGVASGRLIVWLPGATQAVELAMTRLLLPETSHVLEMMQRDVGEE
jgi:molybdenum cofactor biosynthesis protein B